MTSDAQPIQKREEILAINLLRFLAALGVLCAHKFASLVDLGYLPKNLGIFSSFTQYGYLGVNLFFLISGFVITLSSEGRTFGQFISARFIRLFPVFWICVSLSTFFLLFLGTNNHITWPQFFANLTMQPRFYGNYALIDGSYWTLEIELRFYCVIAFILLLRSLIKISLQKISLVLTLPLFYYIFYYNPYEVSLFGRIFDYGIYFFGSEYASYFIAGILFYEIYKGNKSILNYIALTMCYVVATLQAIDQAYSSNNPTIIVLHITLFFLLFFMISQHKITNASFHIFGGYSKKILITLGALTYPLYLLHDNIVSVLLEALSRKELPNFISSILLFFIMGSLIYLVNYADLHIRKIWNASSVVKKILTRSGATWVKKIL
jgi:peptidoglycan/LPS O-acetylase OafA/YrhL